MKLTIASSLLRFAPGRLLAVAMLCGPVCGAALALILLPTRDARSEVNSAVTIDNFTFSQAELNVPVGTTVTWVNHDDIPHSVVQKDKAFRSRALDTDDSYSFTFTAPGTYDYFCGLHPQMVGKIVVKP